jgi:hypothetical protein
VGSSRRLAPSTSAQASGEDEATHFFKSSWPEDIRPREHEILATAIMRVNEHLPERSVLSSWITYQPSLSSNEIYDSSTAIIRTLLGLSTDGARTQYLMCSNLLSNLLGIADDFARFKGILRDVVRGMYIYTDSESSLLTH